MLDHVGLNHLTWERAAVVDGTDRLPELIAAHGEEIAAGVDLAAIGIMERRVRAAISWTSSAPLLRRDAAGLDAVAR